MTYTSTVNYRKCPGLFDDGNLEFSEDECVLSWPEAMPNSPVYDRARKVFSQEGYMYPAPPLFLGKRDIAFPEETTMVLRLLIKEPGSNFMLPRKLDFLADDIKGCSAYQREYFPRWAERFAYLTIRSGPVTTSKDETFHVDGFQGISVPRHIPEQNYLWTSDHPTLFSMQPYFVEGIDPGLHNIHDWFEAKTNKSTLFAGVEKGLYIFDPFHVHARRKVSAGTRRSMFRLCFSPVEIRDDSNMVNIYLPRGPYNRDDIRNRLVSYDGPASDIVNGLQRAI
jgi:hypothetical protein